MDNFNDVYLKKTLKEDENKHILEQKLDVINQNIGGYGTHRIGMVSTRGTSISDVLNVGHQTSGNGGSWSFSKPSSTILRITKNAGSYAGGGAGFVHVVFSSFM